MVDVTGRLFECLALMQRAKWDGPCMGFLGEDFHTQQLIGKYQEAQMCTGKEFDSNLEAVRSWLDRRLYNGRTDQPIGNEIAHYLVNEEYEETARKSFTYNATNNDLILLAAYYIDKILVYDCRDAVSFGGEFEECPEAYAHWKKKLEAISSHISDADLDHLFYEEGRRLISREETKMLSLLHARNTSVWIGNMRKEDRELEFSAGTYVAWDPKWITAPAGQYVVTVRAVKHEKGQYLEYYPYLTTQGDHSVILKIPFVVEDSGTTDLPHGASFIATIRVLGPAPGDGMFGMLRALTGDPCVSFEKQWLTDNLAVEYEKRGDTYILAKDHSMKNKVTVSIKEGVINNLVYRYVDCIKPFRPDHKSAAYKQDKVVISRRVNVKDRHLTFPHKLDDSWGCRH